MLNARKGICEYVTNYSGWCVYIAMRACANMPRVLSFINAINQWLYLYTVITAAIITKCNPPGERTQMHFASEHTITQHQCVCAVHSAATRCYVRRGLSLLIGFVAKFVFISCVHVVCRLNEGINIWLKVGGRVRQILFICTKGISKTIRCFVVC